MYGDPDVDVDTCIFCNKAYLIDGPPHECEGIIKADNKRLRKSNVGLWEDNIRLRKVVAAAEVLIRRRPGDLSWDEAWASEIYGEQILMILGKLELALKELEGDNITKESWDMDKCPACGNPDIEVEESLYAAQTYLQPAEYIYRSTCHKCGWSETD